MEHAKEKRGYFLNRLFWTKEFFLTYLFYLSVLCIKQTFKIYIPLHIKKHYFIHFFACLFKSSRAVGVSSNKHIAIFQNNNTDIGKDLIIPIVLYQCCKKLRRSVNNGYSFCSLIKNLSKKFDCLSREIFFIVKLTAHRFN